MKTPGQLSVKINSNRSLRLFELLEWCGGVARKLHDRKTAVTGSKIDLLQTGKTVSKIPAPVMLADWEDRGFYVDPPLVAYSASGHRRTDPISDMSLWVESSDDQRVVLRVDGDALSTRLTYDISRTPLFAYLNDAQTRVEVVRHRSTEDLVNVLNDDPLHLLLVDGSRLTGAVHYAPPADGFEPFDISLVEPIDWAGEGVDVQIEFAQGAAQPASIQGYLARALDRSENEVVYWDHGSGETADFVTFSRPAGAGVEVRFYHCKSSGGASPGNRVSDVYEVCGQAVKGLIWCDLRRLVARLLQRSRNGTGQAKFIRGDEALLATLANVAPASFEMVVVQPGIANTKPEQKIAEVLASANSYVVGAGLAELRIWGSAKPKR